MNIEHPDSENCPTSNQLAELLAGKLDVNAESAIETHISNCTRCDSTLKQLSESEQLGHWKALLSDSSADDSEFPSESKIREAIQVAIGSSQTLYQDLISEFESSGFESVELIGRGGMGIVFKARQPISNRTVALKVLRNQADDEHHVRMVREATTIAKMDHPNVLKIHDVNHVLGRPCLVLEYVDGPSLAELIARKPQEPRSTAAVVAELSKGVAAAHRYGIIHRDIKPANILMSPQLADTETTPPSRLEDYVPKVADFGLAKEVTSDQSTKTEFTKTNQLLGTPIYISPEQIAAKQDLLGTTTDVYSIGVLLYEMLTGFPPFTGTTPYQILKNIDSLDPISPRRQNRAIPIELEAICFKCLEKNPTARYQNAAEIADELARFLDSKPIFAKPPNWLVRTSKWVRRNPMTSVLLSTLTIGALIGLVVWANVTSHLAGLNSKLENRNLALLQQQEITDQVNSFLQNDLLKQAAAESQMNWLNEAGLGPGSFQRDPTLRSILEKVAGKFENDETVFADQPKIKASLLKTIGETWRSLGSYGDAITSLEQSVGLLGENDWREIAETNRILALCYVANAEFATALKILQQCQESWRSHGDEYNTEVLRLDTDIAEVYLGLRSSDLTALDKAVTHGTRAYEALKSELGENDRLTLRAADTMVKLKLMTNKTREAQEMAGHIAAQTAKTFGETHPVTLNAKYILASTLSSSTRLNDAVDIFVENFEQAVVVFGRDHPTTLFYELHASDRRLKLVHGQPDKQRDFAKRLETIRAQLLELYHDAHPVHKTVNWRLVFMYGMLNEHDKAIALCEEWQSRLLDRPVLDKTTLVEVELALASGLISAGQPVEAIEVLRPCIENCKNTFGPDYLLTTRANNRLGQAYFANRQVDLAVEILEPTYRRQTRLFGASSLETVQTGFNLLICFDNARNYPQLENFARKFMAGLDPKISNHNLYKLRAWGLLCAALTRQKKWEEAESECRDVVSIYEESYPNNPRKFILKNLHGQTLVGLERFQDAKEILMEAWEGFQSLDSISLGKISRNVLLKSAAKNLQLVHEGLGDEEAANRWSQRQQELSSKATQ